MLFLLETMQAILIITTGRGKNLERDFSAQAGVPRSIHLAHAAGANRRDDFIRAKPRAWRVSHRSA